VYRDVWTVFFLPCFGQQCTPGIEIYYSSTHQLNNDQSTNFSNPLFMNYPDIIVTQKKIKKKKRALPNQTQSVISKFRVMHVIIASKSQK
jgi:hypothetical protein